MGLPSFFGLRVAGLAAAVEGAERMHTPEARSKLPDWLNQMRDERVVVTGTGGLLALGGIAGLFLHSTSPASITAIVAAIPLLALGLPSWTGGAKGSPTATKVEPMVDGALTGAVAGLRVKYF